MGKKLLVLGFALAFLLSASAVSAAPALDSAQVKAEVESQFDDFVKDLETIVSIDSGTGNKEGVDKVAAVITEKVAALGGTVDLRPNKNGTHIIARFKGEGKGRILLGLHMDTVFEKGEAAKRPFRFDPATKFAYGPGVGDCKASTIQSLYLVKALNDLGLKKLYNEIVIHFDAEEEEGSPDEVAILNELGKQVDVALILDSAPSGFGIVTQRKGRIVYELKVTGVATHSGTPQSSASAITELANQITLLHKLASPLPKDPQNYTVASLKTRGIEDFGQFIPENAINVGIISSTNTKINRVADSAYAKFELRSFKKAEMNRLDKEIRALPAKKIVPGAKVEYSGYVDCGPLEKTPQAAGLVDLYRSIVKKEYNVNVTERSTGGITVGNYTSEAVPTIDGLGVEAIYGHTADEYADLNTFVPRTVALIHLINQLGDKITLK